MRSPEDNETSDAEHVKSASTDNLGLDGSQVLVTKKSIKKEKKSKKGKEKKSKKSSRILDGCENTDSLVHITPSEVDQVDPAVPMTADQAKRKKEKKKNAKKKRSSALDMSTLPSSGDLDLSMTQDEMHHTPHQSDTDRIHLAERSLDENPLPSSVRESETMQQKIDDRKSSNVSNEMSTKRKNPGKAAKKTTRMEENTAAFPSPQQQNRLYQSDTILSHQNGISFSPANPTKQAAHMHPLNDNEEVQSGTHSGAQKLASTHQNPSTTIPKATSYSETRLKALQWAASSSVMPSFRDAVAALRPPSALETGKVAKQPSELRKQDMERQQSLAIDSFEKSSIPVEGSLHLSDIFDMSRLESSRGVSSATSARRTDSRSNSRSIQLGPDGRVGSKSQQPASRKHLSTPKIETARIDEESQRPIPLFEALTPEGRLKEVDGNAMVTSSQKGNEAESSAKHRPCFGVLCCFKKLL